MVPQTSVFGPLRISTPLDFIAPAVDLVGHDRRPISFLVYLWLAFEQRRRNAVVQISYQELAQCIGVSKSSVQAAVSWLVRRKLLVAIKENATATPRYTVLSPWK